MSDGTPVPRHQSLDHWLQWLADQRKVSPGLPLSELLTREVGEASCPESFLLDLACVDLLNRRRAGEQVLARDFANDLALLAESENFLDLIDAELCVDRELGQPVSLQTYLDRYPDYADEVRELFSISVGRGDPVVAGDVGQPVADRSLSIVMDESERSLDFSIVDRAQRSSSSAAMLEPPITLPDWFSAKQCIATGQGHWLLRGRDSARGESLALKVIRLPAQISATEVDELLDSCEKCANVAHPAWITPIIAAVQQKHFAVIRPWVFGNAWEQSSAKQTPAERTKQLATIAYALQAAHRVGAAHGAVVAGNILINHEGVPQLMDACSSSSGIRRCIGQSSRSSFNWCDRQLLDTQDLIRLVVNESIQWPRVWADRLIPELRTTADLHRDEACGMIGDKLIKWADEKFLGSPSPTASKKWRSRLASWIDGADR